MSYKPRSQSETDAMTMWQEAAVDGGFYWGAMVGHHRQMRGPSRLNEVCPCTPDLDDDAPDPKHMNCIARRQAAIRDVFEKTTSRRLLRAGRAVLRKLGL